MNIYLKALLVVVVLGAITWAGITYPHFVMPLGASSPVGTTGSSAKTIWTVFAPTSNAATTTSILNPFGTTAYIKQTGVECNNFGTSPANNNVSAVTFRSATTSISGQGLQGNVNYATNLTFSTSTLDVYAATSTDGIITGQSRILPASTYLTFTVNATSTTASCLAWADVLPS